MVGVFGSQQQQQREAVPSSEEIRPSRLRKTEAAGRYLTAPTLTTTKCNVVRSDDYQAELQLVYSYLVEFRAGGSRSLHGLEQAISQAVAAELNSCDEMDRPMYKVKTNTRHEFSKDGEPEYSETGLSRMDI